MVAPETARERRALYLVLLAALAVRLTYVVCIPPWEEPDERAHFSYVTRLAEDLRIPVRPSRPPVGLDLSWHLEHAEDCEPPGYYLVMLPLYEAGRAARLDDAGILLILRMATAVLALPVVWLGWLWAASLFPERRAVPLAAACFIAMVPAFANCTASVSPTVMICLFGAAFLAVSAAALRDGLGWRRGALLSAVLAGAQWTHASAVLLLPAAGALALLVRGRDRRVAMAALFLAMAAAAPLYTHNLEAYGHVLSDWRDVAPPPPLGPGFLYDTLRFLFISFWANFGRLNEVNAIWSTPTLIPVKMNVAMLVVSVVSALGLIACARVAGLGPISRGDWRTRMTIVAGILGTLFVTATFAFAVEHGWYPPARYLYPIFPIWALALSLGLWQVLGRSTALVVPAFLLAQNAYLVMRVLLPHYERASGS